MSDTAALLLAFALLAGNACFVGAEFALIAARRTQIEPRAVAGSKRARSTLRAMEHVSLMMAGAQLGITICSLGLGAVGEPAVAHLLEGPFEAAGMPEALLHPVAFALALTIVVFLHMVIGEMVPKNIALAVPERSALALGPVLAVVVTVLRPLIWLLNQGANLVLRLLKVQPKDEITSAFTRDEVAGLVRESRREGLLDDREHDLLAGALQFDDQTAADLAIPPAELVTVPPTATVAELEQLCAKTGFSRLPVRHPDRTWRGYVHVKDLLDTPADKRNQPVEPRCIRPLPTVAAHDPLREVLSVLQRTGAHLAQITLADPTGQPNPTGQTAPQAGLVALEDVLERLVGEVRDATRRTRPVGATST